MYQQGSALFPEGRNAKHTLWELWLTREKPRVCTALSVRDNLQIRKRRTEKTATVIIGRGKRDAGKNLFLSS